MTLRSYTSSYTLGHKQLESLFENPVLIQEKVDGSQFSFGMFDGVLYCRSKKVVLDLDAPEGMFIEGVNYVKSIAHLLPDGWTFRGEYLKSPRHNTLVYDRIPRNHIMLFDVDMGMENYVRHTELPGVADQLGLEAVPALFYGNVLDLQMFQDLMHTPSALGGPMEGVVAKNYHQFNAEKKMLLGKFVSEAFKEKNDKNWKAQKAGQRDIIEVIGDYLTTDARWRKSVQHLRETGQLEDSPRDIGLLIKEIPADVLSDSEDEIKQMLFDWAWPKLSRNVTKNFPQWYKEQLLERQFQNDDAG